LKSKSMKQATRWCATAGTMAACGVLLSLLAGCGAQYRPVVSAISPVGPAGQPSGQFAVVLANTGPTSAGLLTFVDVSGDTVVSTPSVLTNPSLTLPLAFTDTESGGVGYTTNLAGSLDVFPQTNPQALLTRDITPTTLPANAAVTAMTALSTPGGLSSALFTVEPSLNEVGAFSSSGTGVQLVEQLSVPNPVYVVGADGAARAYALSDGTPGSAIAIELTTTQPTISNTLPTGNHPVYGVTSADGERTYIVNRGSGTVTVINSRQNLLDATTPQIPATGTLGTNSVWAILVPTLNQLLVLNQGNGTTAGSLSVISIPLCNAVAQPNNPNCTATNLTDGVGFGTVLATVPVGVGPTMISVLNDASRAYVVNQGNAAAGINGSVSVVNLASDTVTATLPAAATTTGNVIYGHPNTIALTTGTPTGKVYVTATDSTFLTIIRTDLDQVDTHISLQGFGVRVLTTSN
jgi:hypothetical protein